MDDYPALAGCQHGTRKTTLASPMNMSDMTLINAKRAALSAWEFIMQYL